MTTTEDRETVQIVQVPESGATHLMKPNRISLCGLDLADARTVGVVSEPSCAECRARRRGADPRMPYPPEAHYEPEEQVSPEADTDDRVDRLRDYLHTATVDELAVIEDVAARVLGVGRENYDDGFDVANDWRDFRREARDELLDALFYQSAEIKRLEGLLEHATRPENGDAACYWCDRSPDDGLTWIGVGDSMILTCTLCRQRQELETERNHLQEQLEELRDGDGVYYIPQSYVGASAVDWDAVIPIDGNRRLVKRTVGSPTGPANEAPVTDDEADARHALQIAGLRDVVSALRHNQETDRARIRALEGVLEVSADDG